MVIDFIEVLVFEETRECLRTIAGWSRNQDDPAGTGRLKQGKGNEVFTVIPL